MVEPEAKGAADLTGEFEEGDTFRDEENPVRVAPDLSFTVALDDFEGEDPFAGSRFAPVHGNFMIGVCCFPHDENV